MKPSGFQLGFFNYLLERKVMTNRDSILKSRHYFAKKGPSSQGYGFSNSHVWMWELDCEESWAPKNWCIWTVVLEKTLESPLGCKEIQPVHPKGDQSWVFFERNDVKAETPILWPPHALVYCTDVFFLFFWLILLCIIGSSFIHLIRTIQMHSF